MARVNIPSVTLVTCRGPIAPPGAQLLCKPRPPPVPLPCRRENEALETRHAWEAI